MPQTIVVKSRDGKILKEIPAGAIKELYARPTQFEKAVNVMDYAQNFYRVKRKNLAKALREEGMSVWRPIRITRKGETFTVLAQLRNPGFDDYIEVFTNPLSPRSGGTGVGNVQTSGGLETRYYVRKNGEVFMLSKSKFKEQYQKLFGDLPEFLKKYPAKKAKWRYLSQYIYEYTRMRWAKEGKTEKSEKKEG
ncbi:MAG: hypothetical protein GXO27_04985 [Chlorobi bacterium]|nr:hypothetical protein [Chlorobiota bacterium]